MGERVVIYGASGHSGQLVARRVAERGLEPVLCGRDRAKLEAAAHGLGLQLRVASLANPDALDRVFADAAVVVNAAGPFSDTWNPVVSACMRCKAHYLDITAEVPVIEQLAALHAPAVRDEVMIMPAVGFDVVPTDCLARHVARRLGGVRRLVVAVTELDFLTRGSAKTLLRSVATGFMRREGRLVSVPFGSMERSFEFAGGYRPALNVALGDLATGYYSTGAMEIETYVEATPVTRTVLLAARTFGPFARTNPSQVILQSLAELLPEDPTGGREIGDDHSMGIVVEAEDENGNVAAARLRTPEAYTFTGVTAAAIVERVLAGDVEYGFQTPSRVYGSEFVMQLPGVEREDLQ